MEPKEDVLKKGYETYLNKPKDDAKNEDWIEWANRIDAWLEHKKKEEKERKSKVRKLKENLTSVNQANRFYKVENSELKAQLDKYQSSWILNLLKRIFS